MSHLIAHPSNTTYSLLARNPNGFQRCGGLVGRSSLVVCLPILRSLNVEPLHDLLSKVDEVVVQRPGPILEGCEHVPVWLLHVKTAPGIGNCAARETVLGSDLGGRSEFREVAGIVRRDGLADMRPLPVLGGADGLGGGEARRHRHAQLGGGTAGCGFNGVDGGRGGVDGGLASLCRGRSDEGAGAVVVALTESGAGDDGAGRSRLDLDKGPRLGRRLGLAAKGAAVGVEGQLVQLGYVSVERVGLP